MQNRILQGSHTAEDAWDAGQIDRPKGCRKLSGAPQVNLLGALGLKVRRTKREAEEEYREGFRDRCHDPAVESDH